MKKSMLVKPGIALFWIACSAWVYSVSLFDFTCKFPEAKNQMGIIALSAFGPIAVPAIFILSDHPSHRMWRPLNTEQRWDAFHCHFPSLSREDFEYTYNGKTRTLHCDWECK